MPCNVCPSVCLFITHAPLFRGGATYVYESPLGDSSLVMNIHNPFMHCVTSQYVFKPRDVIMLNNRVSLATITYATASQCHVPLNGMFPQDSAAQWNKLWMWKISNFVLSNSLNKRHLNSVWKNINVIKARTSGCVRNEMKRTRLLSLDCIPGFAGHAIQSHSVVHFAVISSRYIISPIYPSVAYNI